MVTKVEGPYDVEWLISEASGQRSRDQAPITLSGGGDVPSGEVLKADGSGGWTPLVVGDTDVSAIVLAINFHKVTVPAAGTLARATVITRDAEIASDKVTHSSADDDADVIARLAAGNNIIGRADVATVYDSTPPAP